MKLTISRHRAFLVLIALAVIVSSLTFVLILRTRTTPVQVSPKAAFEVWYDNGQGLGWQDWENIVQDLQALNSDSNSGNTLATQEDGLALAQDARTASEMPMPIDTTMYTGLMQSLQAAGYDTAAGDTTDATGQLIVATAAIQHIGADLAKYVK